MSNLAFHLPRPTVPIFLRNAVADRLRAPLNQSPGSETSANGETTSVATATGKEVTGNEFSRSTLEFPVRRIYCVGRNYREHALEMGGNPDRELPFFFQKPSDAIVVCCPPSDDSASSTAVSSVPYPPLTNSLHHEAELIVAISKDGLRIPTSNAMEYVYGYALGCDLTRRDLQSGAKKKGRPWDAAKGFDASCPLSPIVPKEEIKTDFLTEGGESSDMPSISLKVNGSIRQQSTIHSMIYSIPEIINHLSQLFWLRKGDLIMTGTPAGVSDLKVGDKVLIECGDLIPCEFVVGPQE